MMLRLLLLLTCIYNLTSLHSNNASLVRERIPEVIGQFCPGINICNENHSPESSSVLFKHFFWTCCTECHCHVNCTEDNTCCFPANLPKDIVENTSGNFQTQEECLFPTSIQQNQVTPVEYQSYYMITSVTKTIKDDTNEETITACGNETVAPWGSIFPVYSPFKRKIYKNTACADAHGVTDGIIWDVIVDCKSRMLHIEASNAVIGIETDQFPNECIVDFIPPKDVINIKDLHCYISLVKRCPENKYKPAYDIGLSTTEIKEFCESDFVSPFRHGKLYANVFCFICDNKFLPDVLYCNSSSDSEKRFNSMGFIGLIDGTFVDSKNRKMIEKAYKRPMVCDSKDTGSCRPVFCSSGQLRDKNGSCRYLTKFWYNQIYVVNINLTSEKIFHVNQIDNIAKQLSGLTKAMKKFWRIDSISYELKQGTGGCTSLLVIVIRKAKKISPQYLMRNIQNLFLQKWRLDLDNDIITLKASFSKSLDVYNNRTNLMAFGDAPKDISAPIHHVLYRDIMLFENLHFITKLNLCKQVEIMSSEFTISEIGTFLYNKKTNQVLFDGEFLFFSVNYSSGGNARICIEDSGMFEAKNSSWQNTALFRTLFFVGVIKIEIVFLFTM